MIAASSPRIRFQVCQCVSYWKFRMESDGIKLADNLKNYEKEQYQISDWCLAYQISFL